MIEEIKEFITKLRAWCNKSGVRLAELDDEGLISSRESETILEQTKDVMELIDALYVSDDLVDEEANPRINYLEDSDVDIRQLMSDWSHYLKLETIPSEFLPLERINFVKRTGGDTQVGDGLPSGGGPDYILSKDSNGNPVWVRIPTLFELDETV